MSSELKTNTISEVTADNGVSIDGLKVKDSGLALGSDADGDIYYRSSGALARLAKGTASQVLTMNSGSTAPEWATTTANPQLVHLETKTVTATANLTFEEKLSSTYDTYMLLGSQIKPDTDNRRVGLQFGVGSAGSVTYRTTEYYAQVQKIESGSYGSVINESDVADAIIAGHGNQGNATNEFAFTQVYLFNTQNSGVRSMGSVSAGGYKFNAEYIYSTGGFVNTIVEAHTSIKILFGTSTYSLSDTGQGKFSLYGIKNG